MRKWVQAVAIGMLLAAAGWLWMPSSSMVKAGGCGERVGTEKVWWDGAELKPGQIGRVTVVAPTELWLSNKAVKTLPSGAVYRVYALGGGYFGVGRGYGIKNDARVRYETPSREKLAAALCVQQAKTSMADVTMNGVAIGDSRAKVEAMYGKAKRKTKNAYGLYWEAYDQGGYKNFLMVSYDRDRVAAMYTNHPIVQTKKGTGIGTAKTVVEARYGRPLAVIQKKDGLYSIQNDEYDTYLVNGRYVTFFYDRYNNNRVDGVLVVNRALEDEKPGFYGTTTEELRTAYEYQIFDLANAARRLHGLPALAWDAKAAAAAREHSEDMAVHHYFSHTNLQGLSLFDRLKRHGIAYRVAGENIAYGQYDAIFVHEAWMHSLGHRQNLLYPDFTRLGVGVAFNSFHQPYYSQEFYAP
ncbi:CAP-associated domain-containing protein [Anoxybacillus geothermalis]|nr:CAP-associated domain-containing protein [Anoxybacillus geothermalis]